MVSRILCLAMSLAVATSFSGFNIAARRQHARAITTLHTVPLSQNAFDVWWAQRRSRNQLVNGQRAGGGAPAHAEQLQLDTESVVLVLTEFLQSVYARQVFNFCQAQPTDIGTIEGMFEKIHLGPSRVQFKLKQAYTNVEGLKERLAMYLRARIPAIAEVHAVQRDGLDIY